MILIIMKARTAVYVVGRGRQEPAKVTLDRSYDNCIDMDRLRLSTGRKEKWRDNER